VHSIQITPAFADLLLLAVLCCWPAGKEKIAKQAGKHITLAF
jgi:hypothetical protein